MTSFFAFSGLFNFISSLFLGILTYLKGKKQYPSKSFVLYFFSVAFWSLGYYFWQVSINENSALFWSRFLMAGAIFIPVFYLHFIISFLNLVEKYKKILFGGYGLSIFFFIVNFTPYFVKGVETELFFPFWPKPSIFYHPFLLMFFSFVVYGWYLLLRALRETKEKIRKQQIKYFLLGTGVGFTGGSTNYFLWYNIPIPPYGNILVIFGVLLVTFALLKYHLFDIRVILTEILVGAMGLLWIIFFFLMPTLQLKGLAFLSFLLFLIFAYYLIKATHQEEKRREEAEALAARERILREEAEKLAIQERALREKAEKLVQSYQRLNRARDQILLSTQHYFRTPLTSLIGFLELILSGTFGKEKIASALQAAKELSKRIEECLDISQFQIGKTVLSLEEAQIEDLIKEVSKELEFQNKEKRLPLIYQFPKNLLPKIKIDQRRMRETLSNLIENAIKHTLKGKIIIGLKELKEKGSILFWVQDTGIGIPKEEQPYIGQMPFERGKEAKKLSPMGKGIGLYLSRLIVEAHGGRLWAESEGKNKGSTFYVELPIKGKDNKKTKK